MTKDAETRIFHSMALEKKPLIPDTLNAIWQQMLKKSHLTARTALLITTTDVEANATLLLTPNYTRFASVAPLFVCTLGYRCEVEIIGVVGYSWWYILIQYAGIRLLLFFVICVLTYLFVGYLKRKFLRPPVVKEVIVTQLVKELPKGKARVYQLKIGLIFDAEKNLLIVDGHEEGKLPLQRSTFICRSYCSSYLLGSSCPGGIKQFTSGECRSFGCR